MVVDFKIYSGYMILGDFNNRSNALMFGLKSFLKLYTTHFLTDKSLILWQLTREESRYGYPRKALRGHGHFVSDVVMSSDGQFALSGSWDGTLRLWDLGT